MNSNLLNRFGILGIISFLSYAAAVVFAPLAYPGYNWLRQAVSDLSAADAPSKVLWSQLSCLYGVCGIICLTMLCVYVHGRLNKVLRIGVYAFTLMHAVSLVGYSMFPLTSSGYAGTFQDVMHMVVTGLVVVMSIFSLVLFIVGGNKEKQYRYFSIASSSALALMLIGAIGTGLVPKAVFGVFERFSTMSAAGFTMFLGICLLRGFEEEKMKEVIKT